MGHAEGAYSSADESEGEGVGGGPEEVADENVDESADVGARDVVVGGSEDDRVAEGAGRSVDGGGEGSTECAIDRHGSVGVVGNNDVDVDGSEGKDVDAVMEERT